MFYYIDENHAYHQNIAEKVTTIIYNQEFKQLQHELEILYKKLNFEKPKKQAFQDALYSFLAQDEGLIPATAL